MMTAIPTPLDDSALHERRREFRRAGEQAQAVAGDLAPRQFWWRPAPDRWSVAECLDHLVLADEAYLAVIDRAIAEGRRRGLAGKAPPRPGWLTRRLLAGVEPPARLRVPAPSAIRPRRPMAAAQDLSPRAVDSPLVRFQALRIRLEHRLAQADGLDLGRVRVRSPFVPLLTISLDTALRVVSAHERRHLAQAGAVRQSADFPAGMQAEG